MNYNFQFNRNQNPGRRIVSNLKSYLWCAEICYYLYLALYIFLIILVSDPNFQVYAIFTVNFLIGALAIAGCQLCRRKLSLNPMEIGRAKTWYSVMLGVSCLLTVVYLGIAILLFSANDIMRLGISFGILFSIVGVPLLIVTLIGFCFYPGFTRIIRGPWAYQENGNQEEEFEV